jgi:hypothetical protein
MEDLEVLRYKFQTVDSLPLYSYAIRAAWLLQSQYQC